MRATTDRAASAGLAGRRFPLGVRAPGRVVESARLANRKGGSMIGRLGIPELIIILAIIILIFGANRLPEIGRGIGKGIKNFKESTREGQNDGKA
jgi:sec-independent protein translocase protein TatA